MAAQEHGRRQTSYPYVGAEGERPPDYARVVRALDDAELEEEILGKRGEPDYQLALLAEHGRRAKEATDG